MPKLTLRARSATSPPANRGLVETNGQAISLSGSGTTLGFLGMADYGLHSGTGTILYSDGSTQQYTLTFPDWFSDGPAGTPDQLVASADSLMP